MSTAEDTGGEASPPKKPAPWESSPRAGGAHRRTASGDIALARTLQMAGSPKQQRSPKLPRRKMERWSEGEIEPSPSAQLEPHTPQVRTRTRTRTRTLTRTLTLPEPEPEPEPESEPEAEPKP